MNDVTNFKLLYDYLLACDLFISQASLPLYRKECNAHFTCSNTNLSFKNDMFNCICPPSSRNTWLSVTHTLLKDWIL